MKDNDPLSPEVDHIRRLVSATLRRAPADAAALLAREDDDTAAQVLRVLSPNFALKVLRAMPPERRDRVLPRDQDYLSQRFELSRHYPRDSVGWFMEPPVAVFPASMSAYAAIEKIRVYAEQQLITYAFVTDRDNHLLGVVIMRDLMLARPDAKLDEVMIADPFFLTPETKVTEAVQAMVRRHYPVYPVCDPEGRLIGLVQGYAMFEEYAVAVSAQAGRMVGVEKEERFSTPWPTALRYRQPWLQLNLLTAFLAAAVVGVFESTIERVVALAVFLPVLAGQAGNTGSQALAITLRSMTLGQCPPSEQGRMLAKESLLGVVNGALVGIPAALGMWIYAASSGAAHPVLLAIVVFMSMVVSCVASGASGVLVPMTLRRFGADPATASTIFLTTATDVVSIGLLLGLGALLLA